MAAPRGIINTEVDKGLNYLAVEVSWGSQWVDINDGVRFKVAQGSRETAVKSWRKITAQSPILGGDYLVHAAPDMVAEQVAVWIRGSTHTELADNIEELGLLFEQWDFRIRWQLDDFREYWRCQLADGSWSMGQVWTHNLMAKAEFTVPRYPTIEKETLG